MAITQTNEYEIGVNNDLGNLANNVDNNRIGEDLTWLELDGGVIKVSVGSFIESQGNLYVVDTAAETPSGTLVAGSFLFFDDSTETFVWSTTAGTFDPARGGIYDASNRRQCKWIAIDTITFRQVIFQEGKAYLQVPNFYPTSEYAVTQSGVGAVREYLSDGRVAVQEVTSVELETWEFANGTWSAVSGGTVTGRFFARMNATRLVNRVNNTLIMVDESAGTWSQTGSATVVSDVGDLFDHCRLAGDNRVVIIDNSTGSEVLEVWDFDGSTFAQSGGSYSLGAGDPRYLCPLGENLIAVFYYTSSAIKVFEYNGTTFNQVGFTLNLPTTIEGNAITGYDIPESFFNGTDFVAIAKRAGNDYIIHFRFNGTNVSVVNTIPQSTSDTNVCLLSKDDNYSLAISEVNNLHYFNNTKGIELFRYER